MEPQPSPSSPSQPKPITDVRAPSQSGAIAVKQAPIDPDAGKAGQASAAESTATTSTPAEPKKAQPKEAKRPKPASTTHLPVGLVVTTVLVMVILSTVAVAVYVTTQS